MGMFTSNKHNLDIQFSFFCRGTHKYKSGQYPIVFRTSYRGERRDIFTGLTCDKEYWLPALGKLDTKTKMANVINRNLEEIRYKAQGQFEELKYSGIDFTIDDLVAKFKGDETPPQTLIEYNHLKLKELEERVDIDLAKTTFYKYKRIVKYIDDFLIERRGVKNIAVGRIDEIFLRQLFMYLRKEKKNEHNSAVALLNCLKTILRTPIKNGTLKNNPFDEFPLTQKPVHRDCLSMEEIKLLQTAEGLSEAQERNRDIFLFCCFTGLAYADIKGLTSSNILVDPDGSKHIMDARQKTGIMSIVPLLPVAEKILLKYTPTYDCRDFVWFIPSNQKLNTSLKEIAKKANIEKPIFMHLARHTFATSITLSHGVPLETVSRMLGHSTIKHTQIYAKIVASKVKGDMKKIMDLF